MIKRCLLLMFAVVWTVTAAAAESQIPAAKKKLIRELLELTDASEGTADAIIDILGGRLGLPLATEVMRGEVRESEQVEEIARQTQMQVYDRYFTEKELRDLVTFFRSKTGRRYVQVARDIAAETRNNLRAETERRLSDTAERARREQTRNDMQTLGLALAAYFTDHSSYPEAKGIDEALAVLVPKYAPTLPQRDAWGHPFQYEASADRLHYRLVSAGADGKFGAESSRDDIVYTDGRFSP